MQSFQFTIHTYLNYFSRTDCSITFHEKTTIYYKTLKVIVYITGKCFFVFNKAIITYIFGWFLMNFTQKLATFVKFRLQFAIQFLAFAFVVSGTNNSSTHLKQGPLCSLIFNLWTVVYFLDIKNTSFCWRFWSEGRLDFQIIVEFLAGQEHFPSSYVNSKLVTMMLLLSPRDCFSIASSCVQYKRICVQRPSLRFDSGWMICWQYQIHLSYDHTLHVRAVSSVDHWRPWHCHA